MKINYKRAVLAGIAATVVSTIWGWVTCGWLFNWVYSLEPTSVWKAMEPLGTWFMWMTLGGLVLNVILATVYALVYKGIPDKGIRKGLWYGLMVWSVGTLPGMFATYMTMVVATTVVVYWAANGLIKYLVLGAVIAAIYKEK